MRREKERKIGSLLQLRLGDFLALVLLFVLIHPFAWALDRDARYAVG